MKRTLVVGIVAIGAWALPSSAAALTCPLTDPAFDRYYTVDPASACVYGNGNINNAGQDDFLTGVGIVGDINGDLILDGETSGAAAGWVAVDYSFDDSSFSDPNWVIPGFDPTLDYLVGIKDGNASPGWAVFLVTAGSGTWSTDPADAWSHAVLYSRDGGGGGNGGSPPEPASLTLFGLGMLGAAYRLRKHRAG